MLGHQLRNPLAAVRNAITAARLDPGRGDRALEIAHRGTDQLARLVDDLLDVARITQGRIPLHVQRLPLAGVVERAVESTRRLVEDRAQAIAVSLPAADVQVDGDATRLEQVVANLVSNAAKYSDPGGRIVVTATVEAGEAVLRVRDDGIGIAPETLPHVFDLFAQGDRALDRAQGGLGIGLTIVKRLVELHGGRVEAHSRGLAQGAEFVVRLPAVLAPRGEAVAPPAATGGLQSGCARVLVVEDNVDAAESLRMLLELLGHRVRVVHDGPHALEVARATPPDVMLVDIGLPGMDGYEVARRAGEDADLRDVVLVALTGYGRGEDRKRALAAGFHHHLVKPVNPDALLGLLANVGPHARSARTGAVPAVEAGSASAAPSRA
jgi:two-component system CheB/CheR fusion protein